MKKLMLGLVAGALLLPAAAAADSGSFAVKGKDDCAGRTTSFAGLRRYVICEDWNHDKIDAAQTRQIRTLRTQVTNLTVEVQNLTTIVNNLSDSEANEKSDPDSNGDLHSNDHNGHGEDSAS